MIINLKNFRLAKRYSSDVKYIFQAIDLFERAMSIFKHYVPVQRILVEVKNQRSILKAHEATALKILNKQEIEKK